jgi:uncharacterized RDD family membrane protein YckC
MHEPPTKVAGQRVAAFLIDSLLAFAVMALFWFLLTDRLDADTTTGGGYVIGDTRYGFASGSDGKRGIWAILTILDYLAVFVIMPGLRGFSPGKKLMKIRVVKADGSPPGVGRAFLRWILLVVVDSFPYFIPYLTGLILMLTTKANQRVGDMAAGTYVLKEEYAGRPVTELAPALSGVVPPAVAAYGTPPPPPSPTGPAPGWYDDPQGQARLRWWDGQRWTDQTAA